MLANLADTLARDCDIGNSGNPAPAEPDPLTLKALELSADDYQEAKQELNDSQSTIDHFFQSSV